MNLAVWSLLTAQSLYRLESADGNLPPAISLSHDVPVATAQAAPLVRAVRMLVERAAPPAGLALTKRGFLRRVDVRAVFEATPWPDHTAWPFDTSAPMNETEAIAVQMTRILARKAGLLRVQNGRLIATRRGLAMVADDQAPALLALLATTAFWKVRLDVFDGVPFGPWPQDHSGIVLWCLSIAAQTWSDAEDLFHSCTIPFEGLNPTMPDLPAFALWARILRPALWLGLMDAQPQSGSAPIGALRTDRVRKNAAFDALFSFNVTLAERKGRAN